MVLGAKKDIFLLFQENGLKITIDTNLIQVNVIDVTLNLESGKYWPYRKEDDLPLYIHKESNHSPSIVKQLPKMIESRISALSCNEDVLTRQRRPTLQVSAAVASSTTSSSQSGPTPPGAGDQESVTLCGSTRHTIQQSRRTSAGNSCLCLTSTSRGTTNFRSSSTETQ